MKPAITPQQERLTDEKNSPLAIYKEIAVGDVSLLKFVYYELTQLFFSNLAGLLGFGFRRIFYPCLFKKCHKSVVFGRGILLRNPAKVVLGKKCLLDDACVIDARGEKSEVALGDFVSVGRGTSIVAKNSSIDIADGVNIGSDCRIATQSKISIGESTLIAAYVYIGPGNHKANGDKPLIAEEMELKGGVSIGKNVWIGTKATILDGVTIGDGAIIGAHALVREDVPAGKTAVGIPARIL